MLFQFGDLTSVARFSASNIIDAAQFCGQALSRRNIFFRPGHANEFLIPGAKDLSDRTQGKLTAGVMNRRQIAPFPENFDKFLRFSFGATNLPKFQRDNSPARH